MKAKKINSLRALGYVGVAAETPIPLVIEDHSPTQNYSRRDTVGTLWMVLEDSPSLVRELWILIDLYGSKDTGTILADWVQLYPSSSEGALYFPTDFGLATSVNSVLNVIGGDNIYTGGVNDTITINLTDNISISGTLTVPVLSEGIVTIDSAGLIGSSFGTDGQVIIGATGAAPDWANIVSGDASMVVTGGANSIDLVVAGGGGGADINAINTDNGVATSNALFITNMVTRDNLTTSVVPNLGNTIYVDLDPNVSISNSLAMASFGSGAVFSNGAGLLSSVGGTNGQVIIGATGAVPDWANITSSDSSVIVSVGPNTIDLRSAVSGSLTGLSDDASNVAVPTGGVIGIEGGLNINTVSAGNVLTVNLDESIFQPNSNAVGDEGVYYIDLVRFMHNYPGTNAFLGRQAGNLTNTGLDNVGLGTNSLLLLSGGDDNVGVGYFSNDSLQNKNDTVALGALSDLGIGSGAIGIGYNNISADDYDVSIGGNIDSSSGGKNVKIGRYAGNVPGETLRYSVIVGYQAATNIGPEGNAYRNIGIGIGAGSNWNGYADDQIAIGSPGFYDTPTNIHDRIFLGDEGTHTNTYVAGIHGTTLSGNYVPVIVSSDASVEGTFDLNSNGEVFISNNPGWDDAYGAYPFVLSDVSGVVGDDSDIIAISNTNFLSYSFNDLASWSQVLISEIGVNTTNYIGYCDSQYAFICASGVDNVRIVRVKIDSPATRNYSATTAVLGNILCGAANSTGDLCVGTQINGCYLLDSTTLAVSSAIAGSPNGLIDMSMFNAYVLGVDGTVNFHVYNGSAWSIQVATNNLRAMSKSTGISPIVVIVGDGGVIYTCTQTGGSFTQRVSSFGVTDINDVVYSTYDDKFYAFGDAGKIASSPDGINWTQETNSFGVANVISGYASDSPGEERVFAFGSTPLIENLDIRNTEDFYVNTITGTTISVTNGSNSINLETNLASSGTRPAFMLYQTVDENNVTGDGTLYYLFSNPSNYSVILDNFSGFSGGQYTTNLSTYGKWYMYVSINLGGLLTPPAPPPPAYIDPLIIDTSNRVYSLQNSPILYLGGISHQTLYFSAVVDLDFADVCKFAFGTWVTGSSKPLGILAETVCAGYRIE